MSTATTSESESDIVVIGGGVAGLAMLAGLDAMDLGRFRGWAAAKQAETKEPTDQHDGVAWENRVISLNNDNLAWLEEIGAASLLVHSRLRPVERIRVWDGLTDAAAEFGEDRTIPLSTMVEISNLQQALLRRVDQHSNVSVRIADHARVTNITADEGWPKVELDIEGKKETLTTRLLVGADGHNSPVRRFAGIESIGWSYGCKGLVATVRTGSLGRSAEPLVDLSAWQRFLPTGTLAFLPLSPTSGTIVWALPPNLCDPLVAMHRTSGGNVLAHLVSAGFRLPWKALEGLIYEALDRVARQDTDWDAFSERIYATVADAESSAGRDMPSAYTGAVPPWADAVDARSVASFPLQLKHASCYLGSSLNQDMGSGLLPAPSTVLASALSAIGVLPAGGGRGQGQPRTVLVGDAAHSTHPLAGQGLNLGLQDVRALVQALEEACLHGLDIGSHGALSPYERARYAPNQAMISATDHLHWLFAIRPNSQFSPNPSPLRSAALDALVWARSTGLEVVNELTPLKRLFAQSAGSR
ncbi:Putative ubiquinone biosynthesis monooxygenase [Malassezia cuniculi]|uniref:Ubiquinone biosynthesis monooxygenase n=1 Tax=Malassezia cuniculi TaxID=948313 RepID=A0AAF0EU20_9BASI|nr:Putative ubiquinone biosynthesis monooxygenase [Malassezia cuniculi]